LSMDLASVDVSRPILAPGIQGFRITDMKVEVNEKGNTFLVTSMQTLCEAKSTKGVTLTPGYKVTDRLMLNESGARDQDMILQGLKRIMLATGRKDGTFGDPAQYVGAEVQAKVFVEVDK